MELGQLADYFGAMVVGIPLIFVVMGLVEWVKSFGVSGKTLNGVSMAIGLLLGSGYQISQVGLPADFAAWFGVVVYGLGMGIVASGLYDGVKNIVQPKS